MKSLSRHSRNVIVIIFSIAALSAQSKAQQPATQDPVLQRLVSEQVNGFHGDVGVYVRNLKTGQTAAINADTMFPTASMIKVSILCGLFDKISKGELKYNQELTYRDSLKHDDGITGSLRDSTKVILSEIAMLMITLSDNSAALWCQQLAGSGTAINEWLETNGFHQMRVNSRTPGREPAREIYGWGQTTPREMVNLFMLIRSWKAVRPDASEEMFRVLSKPYWDEIGLSQIPPTIHVASKNGALDASKSETDLVIAPSGDYVFSVITKNQADHRWVSDNEGYVLIRKISRALWKYFEPQSTWEQPVGVDRWMK